jgi:hypothetical protein
MIRHARAAPHAVGALSIAMIQQTLATALVPHSRRPCADNAGGSAANVPAVRLASVVLAAHEEQGAASAAGEHHESVVHGRGSVAHRLSTSAYKLLVSASTTLDPPGQRCGGAAYRITLRWRR